MKNDYYSVGSEDDGSDEYKKLVGEANGRFQERLEGLDGMYAKMKAGDTSPQGNPFAIRNIFRGVYFDELSKEIVEKTVRDIHSKYNKRGLYLPKEEMPKSVSELPGKPIDSGEDKSKKRDTTFSPQNRFLNRVAK